MKDLDRTTAELGAEAARRAREGLAGASSFTLLVYHRDGARVVTLPSEGAAVIGRDHPSTIVVRERSLSREHARFTCSSGEMWVRDLGSKNGTFVGGKRIDRARVAPGDEVVMGTVVVTVQRLRPAEAALYGLESDDRFRGFVEDELVRARHFGRGFALMLVRAQGEPHLERWSPALKALLAPVDRAGLYARDTVEVLLPEAGADRVAAVASAIAGMGSARLVVGCARHPEDGASVDALIEAAGEAVLAATPERPIVAAERAQPQRGAEAAIVGSAMSALLETAARVARSSVPVLLYGETGAGKEVVARAVHRASKRAERPLVSMSCAAIPAQLVESTLFGHEKGAFTGASERRKGAFETADGGTLFLDEIGELPLAVQAVLLRVIETKRFARVGSSEEIEVDVRLIAATNRDLEAMVAAGTFREDLLYRINTVVLRVPPLRDRPADIRPLAEHFVAQAAAAHDCPVSRIDPGALDLLRRYPWPGNVRELKNAIDRAVVLARDALITIDDLPERVREIAGGAGERDTGDVEPAAEDSDLRARVQRFEADLIRSTLEQTGGNQTEAARVLGVPRRTLVHKLRALGIRGEAE